MSAKVILLSLLILFIGFVCSKPVKQRITVDNHEWEVSNEPGWEEVIKAAELVRQKFRLCLTIDECRRIAEEMRAVFKNYPVSKDYFEKYPDDAEDILATIFKWG